MSLPVSTPSRLLKLVHTVGREKAIHFQPLRLCRPEHQPLCSSSRQHDQHVKQLSGNVANQFSIKPHCRERQLNDGNRYGVLQRVRGFLPAHHQQIARTNCETLEPILATCRPHPRTAEADTSPITCSCCGGAAPFSFPFAPACCDRANSCCVA